jgi:hypothetical protein
LGKERRKVMTGIGLNLLFLQSMKYDALAITYAR